MKGGCLKAILILLLVLLSIPLLFLFLLSAFAFYGISLTIIIPVLSYFSPSYCGWLETQTGYKLRLSRLPGMKTSSSGTLAIASFIYLAALTFFSLLFFWTAYTNLVSTIFVGILGLIGLLLIYGWLIKGWRTSSKKPKEIESDVGDEPAPQPMKFPWQSVVNDISTSRASLIPAIIAIVIPFVCVGSVFVWGVVNEPLREIGMLPTYTPTATSTLTPTPTHTPTPTLPPTSTNTPEPTPTAEPTNTPRPTDTPAPTNTPSPTDTPEPSADDLINQQIQSLVCDEDVFMQRLADTSAFIDLDRSSYPNKTVVFKDGYVETEYYAYEKSLEASARFLRDFPCLGELQVVIYRSGQKYVTDVELSDFEEFLGVDFELLKGDINNWRTFLERIDKSLVQSFAKRYITQELASDIVSPQAALESALKDVLGESNRNRDDRVLVLIEDSTIYVTFRIQDNFSAEWIRDGMGQDTLQILYVVRNSGLPYDELVVEGTFPLVDAYGNTEESTVLVATYKKDTVERINFEGTVKMFAIVDDELFIHPAMLKD